MFGVGKPIAKSGRRLFLALGSVLIAVLVAGAPPAAAEVWSAQFVPKPPGAKALDLSDVSCTSRTNCMVVGAYSTSGGDRPLVERWNGFRWSIRPVPSLPSSGSQSGTDLNGVACATPTDCIAVGTYLASQDDYIHPLAEHWNGFTWSLEWIKTFGGLIDVSCPSTSSCMAVGNLAMQWNGRTWSTGRVKSAPLFSPTLAGISCWSATACIAVGSQLSDEGANGSIVNRWNGRKWSLQSSSQEEDALFDVTCTSGSWCMSVGSSNVDQRPLAERWNGSRWSSEFGVTRTNPQRWYEFTGVSCTSPSACTAVGDMSPLSEGSALPLAERWNGMRWSLESVSEPAGAKAMALGRVFCLSPTACVATGAFTDRTGHFEPIVESTMLPDSN